MSIYKISGTTTHDADVHVIQGDSYFGKKAVSAGNYEVSFESTTPSGVITVAEKANDHTLSYGGVEAITSSGIADLSAVGGANIVSIQQGEITTVSTDPTKTTTINEVNTTKSILIPNGARTVADASVSSEARFELTNSTTITIYKVASSTTHYRFTVIEFSGNVSVQSGTITMMNSVQNTATINSVDTSKAFVIHLGEDPQVSNQLSRTRCTLELTNSTTITCKNTQSNADTIVGYMVVEML